MCRWSGERHLVPVLDLINCQEGPDSTLVHETNRKDHHAETKASWSFLKGTQVFENYGQSNAIYLLFHGFVLKNNTHDCVHMVLTNTNTLSSSDTQVGLLR